MTERAFYLRATVLAYLVWLGIFEVVGRLAATLHTSDLTLPLDRAIPFAPQFIWIYELCYLFPFVPLLAVKDWHRFNRALLAAVLANLVAFAFYLAVPVAFPRPVPGAGWSARVVALEYAVDFSPGANKLPSLHVVFAWLVWLSCRCQGLGVPAAFSILSGAFAISLSTLLVKQHIVVDVIGGVALALAGWALAGRLYPRLANGRSPRRALVEVARRAGLPALGAVALMLAARAALRGRWP